MKKVSSGYIIGESFRNRLIRQILSWERSSDVQNRSTDRNKIRLRK